MARFSMRIVDADFYLAKPINGIDICFSQFQQSDTQRIPIVRIFGSTASGQKACLHLHQTFPYIYVQVSEGDASYRFAKQFASSLDLAIHISLGRPASNAHNYVYDVSVVNGITFYGFHDKDEHFLKICLYNPNLIKKVEEILLNGSIMNRTFQPYEGHIPYLLQFFIDYNLYGMNYIHLANMKFRQPVLFSGDLPAGDKMAAMTPKHMKRTKSTFLSPLSSPSQTCYNTWHPDDLNENMLVPNSVERQSTCLLEVDAIASDILNRKEVKESLGTCPGLASIWEEERQRRRLNNESTDISSPAQQEQRQTLIHNTEENLLEEFRAILEDRRRRSIEMNLSESSESSDFNSPNLISDDGRTSETEFPLANANLDDTQPIVDEDAVLHSFCQSSLPDQSTPSASQILPSTLDNQLADILADIAKTQDTILSQASSLTNGIDEEEVDPENIDRLQEDDMNETLMMSQHVYDDIEDGEENVINQQDNKKGSCEKDEVLEQDFGDSWGASFIDEIPQLDGTFDIEDTIHKTCKRSEGAYAKSSYINMDASSARKTARHIAPCNCVGSSDVVTVSRNLRDFEILQVDGSSDSDFLENDPKLKVKCKKTPIRTYEKSGRMALRGIKGLKKNEMGPHNSLQRKDEKTEIECSSTDSSRAGDLPTCEPGGSAKIEIERRKNCGVDDEKTAGAGISKRKFVTGKCERKKQSIFSNQVSWSNSSFTSQNDGVMPPKAFYSKSKNPSVPKAANSKVNHRKRLSLKPLEFVETGGGRSELSKSGKTRVSRSDYKNKSISFTEIVPDLNRTNLNLKIIKDNEETEKTPVPEHATSSFENISTSGKVSVVETTCQSSVLANLSQVSMAEEEAGPSQSSVELITNRLGSEELFSPLTPCLESDSKYLVEDSCSSRQVSPQLHRPLSTECIGPKIQDGDYDFGRARAGSVKSSNSRIRECYVSLTDIHSVKSLSPPAEPSLSMKRKTLTSKQSCFKRVRIDNSEGKYDAGYADKDIWRSKGGIIIGTEDFCDSDSCHSCYDSLFKSSFGSPERLDSPSSPPRASSPTETADYTKLLPPHEVSASSLRGIGRSNAIRSVAAKDFMENKDPCGVRIQFQSDRSCAQIKPVRLNFDTALKGCVDTKSEAEEVLKPCHPKGRNVSFSKESGRIDSGNFDTSVEGPSACISTQFDSRETLKGLADEEDSWQIAGHSLASVDSPQSHDYCVQFSPLVVDLTSSKSQGMVHIRDKWKRKYGRGKLRLRKQNAKFECSEVFDIPSVGGTTQSEVPSKGELPENHNDSSLKNLSVVDSMDSRKTDGTQEGTDNDVIAEGNRQTSAASNQSSRTDALPKQCCIVGQEMLSSNLMGSDKNQRKDVSFSILESSEIILANDSVVLKPEEDAVNGVCMDGSIMEASCSASFGKRTLNSKVGIDSDGREYISSVKSIARKHSDNVVPENGGYGLQVKERKQNDSFSASSTTHNELPCTASPLVNVLSSEEDSAKSAVASSYNKCQGSCEKRFTSRLPTHESVIQQSSFNSLANADSENQDALLSPSLQVTTSRERQAAVAQDSQRHFHVTKQSCIIFTPLRKPPTRAEILGTSKMFGLGETRHQKAFFSNPKDLPARTSIVGGHRLRIKSTQLSKLPLFETESGFQRSLERFQSEQLMNTSLYQDLRNQAAVLDMNKSDLNRFLASDRKIVLTPCRKPPKHSDIKLWLKEKLLKDEKKKIKENIRQSTNLKSPNATAIQEANTPTNNSLFKSAEGLKDRANRLPKQRSSPAVVSPQFSPPVASSGPGSATSPISSTPLISKRKATTRPQLASGIVGKSKHDCGSPAAATATPIQLNRAVSDTSDVDGPTPKNSYGFGFTQVNYDNARNEHEIQHLTLLSMELHVNTRRDLCPDPSFDSICAIFYHMTCETNDSRETGVFVIEPRNCEESGTRDNATATKEAKDTSIRSETSNVSACSSTADQGIGGTASRNFLNKSGVSDHVQRYFCDEKRMIMAFQSFVRSHDPDMLIGYEIQMTSWGYLMDRAKQLDIILCPLLSRIPSATEVSRSSDDSEKEALLYGHMNEFKITGRILLNVWRIMRSEVTLRVYSFENVAFHVLHQRLPKYSFRTLSSWWGHQSALHRWRVVDYYVKRCRANLEMLIRTDFISRTSELARLFGILFYSVISRGSQFRVESMMLRIAKPMGYIPVSPSVRQRALMAAPEVIALVMEPESRFYSDPVIVLDFQSLYPSIIIAYNYCFSTCLGRVKHWNESSNFKFGATSLSIPTSVFEAIKDHIHISPNGVGFVKQKIRKGILPRMLDDILKTRIMVKNSMKKNKKNKALHRMLDARQLGLKLIANVTYGYTSANFSGRMPCVEIADSVVRKGREALETAINLINSTEKWNARVVYGDTDSVFILMKGATKKRAFEVGNEIVDAVTKINPLPMKLKFEKVYLPCILQTKKRYVGYMYETLDQKEAVFDAKGIETVRRDSCAAVSKILERSLKTLFETKDLSLVKKYIERQFTKIMEDRVSIQDFTFAKEYRGSNSYRPGACVPALSIARRLLAHDKRAEPRPGERVPYVVVYGTPGLPLIQLVKRPCELMENPNLRLNGSYYITKQIIPSLNRMFSLIGVDIFDWYNELPRPQRKIRQQEPLVGKKKKGTISQYFSSTHCPICGELTRGNICGDCKSDPQRAVTILSYRVMYCERKFAHLSELCCHCTGSRDQIRKCISQDCPILHKLYHVRNDLGTASAYRRVLDEIT